MFLYLLIVFLRFVSAPFIFIQPLLAIILSVFFDIIDADFAFKVMSKKRYQFIDKNLDLWWFFNIMFFSWNYFSEYKYFLFVLFIFRFVGQLIYYGTDARKILVFFPNFFEWIFFLIFIGVNYYPSILESQNYLLLLSLIFIVKIFQEWFFHMADLSIREIIFKSKRSWKK